MIAQSNRACCVTSKFNKMCISFFVFRKREERQPLACPSAVVAVNCSTLLPIICSATLFWWHSYNSWPNGCWDWEAFIFRHSVAPPSRHFRLGAELSFLVTLYILWYCITCSQMATRPFKGTILLSTSNGGGVQMLCSHMATTHLKGFNKTDHFVFVCFAIF